MNYDLDIATYMKICCNNKEEMLYSMNSESSRNAIIDKDNYSSTLRCLILLLKELSKVEDQNLMNNSTFAFYLTGNSR